MVNEISLELRSINAQVVVVNESITILSFLEMLEKVFHNQVQYSCLLLSFVHLMQQNKIISNRYKQTENDRNAVISTNIGALVKADYLITKEDGDVEFLTSSLALIMRFWISEAVVSFNYMSEQEQIKYYLSLIMKLLSNYATDKGITEIKEFERRLKRVLPSN